MKISRIWAMPNKWTFTIKPIKECVFKYHSGVWVDPFSGKNSPAFYQNDLNPDLKILNNFDGLTFLKQFSDSSVDGCFYDPPYSITQAAQCYKSYGKEKLKTSVANMSYWKQVKDEMARIIKPGGNVICCGWTSQGLGKGRNFEMIEILLVPHGGSKNDTIITVERKI